MHHRRIVVLILFYVAGTCQIFAQVPQNRYIIQALDTMQSLASRVQILESFGIKEIGTAELERAGLWLDSFYRQLGYETRKDSFNHLGHNLFNVIAEKRSADTSASWLIICAHYDTKNGSGANDNGSGVAAAMEIGRQLSSVNEPRAHIRIIHFSAEEYNLAGSRHYTNNPLGPSPEEVLLVFNLDQLGGTKDTDDNHKIYCERDEDPPSVNNEISWLYTDTLAAIVRTYTALTPVISKAFGSDYVPFQQKEFNINGLYQFSKYPFYHTTGDLLERMDTFWLQEAGKAALAYVLYLAGSDYHGLSTENPHSNRVSNVVFPNPSEGMLNFNQPFSSVMVYNTEGRLILEINSPKMSVNLSHLASGVYTLKFIGEKQKISWLKWIKL